MPLPPDLGKPIFALMPHLADRVINGVCTYCAVTLDMFRDELSAKEYSISGMCQSCQDKTFGLTEEELDELEEDEPCVTRKWVDGKWKDISDAYNDETYE